MNNEREVYHVCTCMYWKKMPFCLFLVIIIITAKKVLSQDIQPTAISTYINKNKATYSCNRSLTKDL